MMKNYRVTQTTEELVPFIWLLVTDKAEGVLATGLFDLYAIYDDGTESLIENEKDLDEALDDGVDIGIEVGNVETKGQWIGVELDTAESPTKVLIGLNIDEYGNNSVEFCNTKDIAISPEDPWCDRATMSVVDEDSRVFDDNYNLIN